MKEIRSKSSAIIVLIAAFMLSHSCKPDDPEIIEYTGDTQEQWTVIEYNFKSITSYEDCFNDVDVDVVFKHEEGEEYLMPAFWHGDSTWTVRFAPPILGIWTYNSVCTDISDTGLHDISGEFKCIEYEGEHLIYKKGFVKTETGKRHFVYDDGTPFFYLSDAQMNFAVPHIDNFKTIIDKRVEQGFTALATEPLGVNYNLSNGLTEYDMNGFKRLDERFQYTAEKGLVHANSQFFFVSELGYNGHLFSDEYLEKLSRYWVARYGAYPVLWTTAQECDDDYKFPPWSDHNYYDRDTNPWKKVASYIHKYDPYNHPLTAHMEHSAFTTASGSSFREIEGHDWWGIQWSPVKNGQMGFNVARDFWDNGQDKVSILYEGKFDYLWTNHFGCRVQAWSAFLLGLYGYGYGAIDIWLYKSTYDMDTESVDGNIVITPEMKATKWDVALEFETGYQMGYMKEFFIRSQWWNLVPRFGDSNWFEGGGSYYALASKDNEIYVAYFYNPDLRTGRVKNLENTSYTVEWYDPRLGYSADSEIVQISNGMYEIGDKPDENDWVLLMRKK